MSYRIAGIDVHKKMLAVVVTDVEVEGEYEFERRLFGTTPDHLRLLSEWLVEQGVEEVVMESTAQGRKSRGSKQSLNESVPLSPRTLHVPLSSKIASSSLAGAGKRASRYIKQGRGLSPLPEGETTTPNYSLNDARSGSDNTTASTYPLRRRSHPLRVPIIA
jgi:hypothetical protein